MINNNVYVYDAKIFKYACKEFNPSRYYPEGLDLTVKSDPDIYDAVRNLFIEMKLDSENIGTTKWNPFSEFIKKGNKVVIKPNLVKHMNECVDGNTDSLITNFSVIRPIIDYTLIALNGTGSVIVGDAPVQECDFKEVIKLYGLEKAIKIYNSNNYKIELKDFRKNNNPNVKCTIIDLGADSSLVETDKFAKKYAITNYNLKYMHEHHNSGKHEYLIANDIMEADVIINVPKPKTHRKAGMTACMKNFIGANGKKEYLPHHRNGSIAHNGDEYPENSLLKWCKSIVENHIYTKNKFIMFLNRAFGFILRKLNKARFEEGSWYGNDTIWRTILDINKIMLYADKNGVMTDKIQRTIFNVADMIISGEKEGPLMPTNKKVGIILAGFNQLNMDKTIAGIMGFDYNKIKYIKGGYELKKYTMSYSSDFYTYLNGNEIEPKSIDKKFIPTDGWSDYL